MMHLLSYPSLQYTKQSHDYVYIKYEDCLGTYLLQVFYFINLVLIVFKHLQVL